MSRFHCYAPYIKVLLVSVEYEIENWEPLAEYSKDNELLPNLVELKCEKFDPQPLSVFLPPSTQKLTIGKLLENPWEQLDMARARQFLEHAAHRCPSLRSLEFHPEPTGGAHCSNSG
ncbi:hypothetical protein FRC10_007410, partial [Ceratobasidium sp. 414]